MGNEDTETKYLDMEVKALKEDGTFEGYGSVFNNVDFGDDVIHTGAFKKTLKDTNKRALFLMHDIYNPQGGVKLKEDDTGLKVSGALNFEIGPGVKAIYGMVKDGTIDRMSIGYRAIKTRWEETKTKVIRHIDELRLFEVSLIYAGMAMNPKALITDVKNANDMFEFIKQNKDDLVIRDKIFSLYGVMPDVLIKESTSDKKSGTEILEIVNQNLSFLKEQ